MKKLILCDLDTTENGYNYDCNRMDNCSDYDDPCEFCSHRCYKEIEVPDEFDALYEERKKATWQLDTINDKIARAWCKHYYSMVGKYYRYKDIYMQNYAYIYVHKVNDFNDGVRIHGIKIAYNDTPDNLNLFFNLDGCGMLEIEFDKSKNYTFEEITQEKFKTELENVINATKVAFCEMFNTGNFDID